MMFLEFSDASETGGRFDVGIFSYYALLFFFLLGQSLHWFAHRRLVEGVNDDVTARRLRPFLFLLPALL